MTTEISAQEALAHSVLAAWRPYILAHNKRAADWLAHDLCLAPNAWRFLYRASDLIGEREPTVFVLENWRYQRDVADWTLIEMALKGHQACVIHIPPKDELLVDEWLEQVLVAMDSVRVRPRFAQS